MRFLIIGQGLAGTLLGFRLERAGHTVHYRDAPDQTAASQVAAGIINPITGRRFVKSWRIDELLPEARLLYQELEAELVARFWYDMPLIRTLYNRGDRNDWEARSGDPGYPEYLEDDPDPGRIVELTTPVFAYAGVRHAARVDVRELVLRYRERITSTGQLRTEHFSYAQLPSLLNRDSGGSGGRRRAGAGSGPEYDHCICCEGWRARHNPYFSYLPHGGNKGEILIIRTAEPVLDRMFKHRVFLVPLADNTYWVGATSENSFTDDAPTPGNYRFLADRLAEVLRVPFEIIDHRAAVRPTVKDRRMFLGRHPELPSLWIFNGLGTKGASLAPLGSQWMRDAILTGKPLPQEVDIARF